MMWWNEGLSGGVWILMTLFMVAFWGLVVFGIVAIFRGLAVGGRTTNPPLERDPEQILHERFARGEIDPEEYHAAQQALFTGKRVSRA